MRLALIVSSFIIAFSCKPKELSVSQQRVTSQLFISEFKLHYFEKLLLAGFNNSADFKRGTSLDRSHFAEMLLSAEDLKIINENVLIDNQFMAADSANSIGKRAEGAEGKQVYKFALKKYQSKWLDSTAKARFKIYWKSQENFYKSLKKE